MFSTGKLYSVSKLEMFCPSLFLIAKSLLTLVLAEHFWVSCGLRKVFWSKVDLCVQVKKKTQTTRKQTDMPSIKSLKFHSLLKGFWSSKWPGFVFFPFELFFLECKGCLMLKRQPSFKIFLSLMFPFYNYFNLVNCSKIIWLSETNTKHLFLNLICYIFQLLLRFILKAL